MKKSGFTLIELLIVVLIIAILAAIAVPNFLEFQTRAKVSRIHSDMRTLATEIEAYYVDNNAYPISRLSGANRFGAAVHNFVSISTPIAYISTVEVSGIFTENDTKAWERRHQFINIEGGFREIQANGAFDGVTETQANLPFGLRMNGADGHVQHIAWMLENAGPDQEIPDPQIEGYGAKVRGLYILTKDWGYKAFSERGSAVTYDPTNGTVSIGNIYRTSAGIRE